MMPFSIKRSFGLSGNLTKLYADEIRLHNNSNKAKLGYARLDHSGILLAITRWKVIGFMESEVVRWLSFQYLSNHDIAEIIDENNFKEASFGFF